MKDYVVALVESNNKRDEYLDSQLDKHQDRLNRHRGDLGTLRDQIKELQSLVNKMDHENGLLWNRLKDLEDKKCHCQEPK